MLAFCHRLFMRGTCWLAMGEMDDILRRAEINTRRGLRFAKMDFRTKRAEKYVQDAEICVAFNIFQNRAHPCFPGCVISPIL
jgi:hypothetical protein